VAPAQSKRRSRKRRRSATATRQRAPQAAQVQTVLAARRDPGLLATTLTGRTYGERPPNPFGGVPVSEIAIFAGAIGVIVGLVSKAAPALVVGIVVCTLGVTEVTAREHFSGYRSHATLLAAIPAVGIGVAMIALIGGSLRRGPLLLVVVPVFLVLFWLLRKRFRAARQARLVRPPAP
jgi:hypothetical protein